MAEVEGDVVTLHSAIDFDGAQAPPVLLLHSLAMDHTIWDPHVERVDERFPLVRCDLPGHGRSPNVGPITVEDMSDQVAALLQELPWSRYVVSGLSLGGCVSQALAIRHPALVAALVLVDTTSWYGKDAVEAWEQRAMKARSEGFDSLSSFQLDRWFGPEFRATHPEVGTALLEIFRANDVDSYVSVCRAMGRFDARSSLGSIGVPTRVIVGELDPATPVAYAQSLTNSIAGATLRILAGAGHMSPVEYPDAFVDELLDMHTRVTATV